MLLVFQSFDTERNSSGQYGLLITNGEFTAFCDPGSDGAALKPGGVCHGASPVHVLVGPQNTGSVRFVNSAFWGPARLVAEIRGSGTVGFSECNFNSWDCPPELRPGFPSASCGTGPGGNGTGRHALEYLGNGTAIVRGCDFQQASTNQVLLGKDMQRAVVMGNTMNGAIGTHLTVLT